MKAKSLHYIRNSVEHNPYRIILQVVFVQLHVCPHAGEVVQALALILRAAHEESGSAALALAGAAGL